MAYPPSDRMTKVEDLGGHDVLEVILLCRGPTSLPLRTGMFALSLAESLATCFVGNVEHHSQIQEIQEIGECGTGTGDALQNHHPYRTARTRSIGESAVVRLPVVGAPGGFFP